MPTSSSSSSPSRQDVKPKLECARTLEKHSHATLKSSHGVKFESKLEDVTDDEKCMKREEKTHRPHFPRRCRVCWIEVPSKQSVMRSYRLNLTRFTNDTSWIQNTRPSITQPPRRSEPSEDENMLDLMPPARHQSVVSLTETLDARRSISPAHFRSFSELDAMDVDDLATPPPFLEHVEPPSPTASETVVRRSSTPPDAADPDIIDLTFEAPVEPPSGEPQINIDFNPKIKAIKNELVIPFDIFAERYARIGGHRLYPIALDPEFRDKPTTRKVISGLYGGNTQEAFPRPSKQKIARHGIQDFMCLNYDWHPNAPKFPGAPGFYFAVGDVHAEDCDVGLKSGPHRLITKFEPAKWQYLGQYRAIPSKSLTKEEWMSLSNKCKDTWIDGILKSSWGVRIREKIAYTNGLDDNPSKEDIMSAFDSGEMFIAVWGMKCVGYDEAFQRSLVNERLPSPPPP